MLLFRCFRQCPVAHLSCRCKHTPLQLTRMSSIKACATLHYEKAHVNGQWVAAKYGNIFEVLNPSTGAMVGTVPDMDVADVQKAIEAACTAFDTWKHTSPKHRSDILRRWFELMIKNKTALATLMTLEAGKPVAQAEAEIQLAANFVEWFSEECRRTYGDVLPPDPTNSKRMMVVRQPVGVVGLITPWNFPSAMVTRKAGPALAAGCTCVIKPSEDTPFSALALCQLAQQAGVPPGVINVVTCSRDNASVVGKELCENPLVSKISFTGSTDVGKILLAQSATTVKKTSMELGGNAPLIVFDSADIELAVEGFMFAKFRNAGQACSAANRILVQEGVYSQFVSAMSEAVKAQITVGDGLEPSTTMGPLINTRAVHKVDGLVEDAVQKGAKVVLGGQKDSRGPCFYQPTVLSDVTLDMNITQQEIFGPVAPVVKFKREQDAVDMANATRYGLSAYFYTSDIKQAWRVSEQLQFGMVGVNESFLATPEATISGWKESGIGKESGKYGINEYLHYKSICYGGLQQTL